MSSVADSTIYQVSSHSQMDGHEFIKKEIIYILDQNNGSYSSNQIYFDTSSVSNSGKWASYSEAYFLIPFVISFKGSLDITGNNVVSAFSAGMKNGYWQIIDSMQVDLNGVNIVQQTPYLNVFTHFKVMSSWSEGDALKYGSSLGFFKDDSTSAIYSAAVSTGGNGVLNNSVLFAAQTVNTATLTGSAMNSGYLNRLISTSYSAASSFGGLSAFYTAPTSTGLNNFTNNAGAAAARIWYWSILAKIRLKDLCDFFDKVPLLKGSFYRITLNVNTSSQVITTANGAATMGIAAANDLTVSGRTNPIMLSSGAANQPLAAAIAVYGAGAGGGTTTLTCGVCSTTNNGTVIQNNILSSGCRLYVPVYTMSPVYEESYITAHPTKSIEYFDLYSFLVSNVTAGTNFQYLLTNGIASPMSLLVVPLLNGTAGNNAAIAFSEIQSPFSTTPATTMPLAAIQNFQVQLAGVNLFSQQQQYDFDQFMSELSKTGLNGGQITGLCSGLISETDFKYAYRYYYANLSRRLAQDDAFPKSVQIQGINASAKIMDLLTFITYKRQITVDTVSGAIVSE